MLWFRDYIADRLNLDCTLADAKPHISSELVRILSGAVDEKRLEPYMTGIPPKTTPREIDPSSDLLVWVDKDDASRIYMNYWYNLDGYRYFDIAGVHFDSSEKPTLHFPQTVEPHLDARMHS